MASSPSRPTWWSACGRLFRHALYGVAQSGGAALGVCGVALLWAGVWQSLSAERAHALQAAIQDMSNLSRAFEEHIVRSVKAIDQTLLYIRDQYREDPAAFDVVDWTRRTQALTDMTFQIAMIEKDGLMRASNLAVPGARVDLHDREHFRVQRDSPADELFISKPLLGRVSLQWSIQMTRKVFSQTGSFDGVIVISLDPLYLSRLYDSVDLGQRGEVTLIGQDGVIRADAHGRLNDEGDFRPASGPARDSAVGRSLVDDRILAEFAKRPAGTFIGPSGVDGVRRVMAYRGVRGTKLVVAVGVAEDEVLAAYFDNRRSYTLVAALLTALLLGATVLIVVRQVRLSRTRAELAVSRGGFVTKSGLLETTLEHMDQGILMVDAESRVQVCNRRALEMLGLPDTLMARHPAAAEVLEWDGRAPVADATTAWLHALMQPLGPAAESEIAEQTLASGAVMEVRSSPMPGGGVVRTFTDVTDRKQTERVLRAARDESDRAARAKSEFLATMSHEIRSPMSGLLGVLGLLRGTTLDAQQTHMADMVHNAASSLLAVLNDILDFSKIEAGAMSVSPEPARLRDLLVEVAEPHGLAAVQKGVAFQIAIAPEVPDVVRTDPLRLRQILNNLLNNATKFTAAGAIGLAVAVVEASADAEPTDTASVDAAALNDAAIDDAAIGARGAGGAALRFTVSDTGLGMTPETLARLFEPFTQADGSTSRNFGGTGLGLCISRRLGRLLGGDLAVVSAAGEGSAFTLTLPLQTVHAADLAPPPASAISGDWIGHGRVLVVDDDPTNRWLTQRQLELLGLDVEIAVDGLTAYARLRDARFDVVVTDCHMPRMDGVALTRALRSDADPLLRALPIIGLTADVTATQRARCEDAGMSDLAIKPLTRERLSRVVARHLPPLPGEAARTAEPAPAAPEPPVAQADAPVFDATFLHELFEPGDPEAADWLEDYLAAADESGAALARLVRPPESAALDRAALAASAHRLAGASLSVGATRLGEQARRLEQAAPTAAEAAIAAAHAALLDEHEAVRDAVAALISSTRTQTELVR